MILKIKKYLAISLILTVGLIPNISSAATNPIAPGSTRIALIEYSNTSDYVDALNTGFSAQAKSIGVEVEEFNAKLDSSVQAQQIDSQIGPLTQAIVVIGGVASFICPAINRAIDAGIYVVIHDVDTRQCAPRAFFASQSDESLASLVLRQQVKDLKKFKKVGYVSFAGLSYLDSRDVVWDRFKRNNQWVQQFSVGKNATDLANENAKLVDDQLKKSTDLKAIFAANGELAKGSLAAIYQNKMDNKIWLYSIDVSDSIIELMRKPNSPWRATSGNDPKAIGAAICRIAVLKIAKALKGNEYRFLGALVTSDLLNKQNITSMEELRKAIPNLRLEKVATAKWIRIPTFQSQKVETSE